MKIYLAGKISAHGWRDDLIDGAGETGRGPHTLDGCEDPSEREWPVSPAAVFSEHDYVGPYFIGDDHGCGHASNAHGNGIETATCFSSPTRAFVAEQCRKAIAKADLFFAWLTDSSAYGTLVEIGLAKERGIKIAIGHREPMPDLWFALQMADHVVVAETARLALERSIAHLFPGPIVDLCGSPAEAAMLEGLRAVGVQGFEQQYPIDRYKLDFAWPEKKLAVEVDGFAYHDAKPEQAEHDKRRDRNLQMKGWRTIRFAAREVFRDRHGCARQVVQMLGGLQ